jgi:hypothetical protein
LSEIPSNESHRHAGCETCPTCKSENWKSARLVVLEGTSHSRGSVSGALTDPGFFSGRVSDIFLSDRWFSFDHPIALETEGVTLTAFAESIKKVLVVEGRRIPEAIRPKDPLRPESPAPLQTINFLNRVRPGSKPLPPTYPILPDPPVPMHWLRHFFNLLLRTLITIPLAFLAFLVGSYFLPDTYVMAFVENPSMTVFGIPMSWIIDRSGLGHLGPISEDTIRRAIALIGVMALFSASLIGMPFEAFKRNERLANQHYKKVEALKGAYGKALYAYDVANHKYLTDLAKESRQKIEVSEDVERFERDKMKYEAELKIYNSQLEENKSEYLNEVGRVERARSVLWDQMRVCIRCGNAYLGL